MEGVLQVLLLICKLNLYLDLFFKIYREWSWQPVLMKYFFLFQRKFLIFSVAFFWNFIWKWQPVLTEFIIYFWGNFIFFLGIFLNILYITVHLFLRKNGFVCTEIFSQLYILFKVMAVFDPLGSLFKTNNELDIAKIL